MHHRHRIFLVTLAIVAATSIAGCAPEPGIKQNATGAQKNNSSATTATPSPEGKVTSPSQTAVPTTLKSVPPSITCETALPLDSLYAFDSNLALIPNDRSISSSVVDKQATLQNVFCKLIHISTGETIQYGIVRLTKESAKEQSRTIAAAPQAESFQATVSQKGQFLAPTGQFVQGDYWISVSSPEFNLPADAEVWASLIAQEIR